jgi:hypothetical protein
MKFTNNIDFNFFAKKKKKTKTKRSRDVYQRWDTFFSFSFSSASRQQISNLDQDL